VYDRLWRALADEPLLDEVVGDYRWDTPLQVAAAFHYLVLGGELSWDEPPAVALREHGEKLCAFLAEHQVQTNEVQRSWMLLPCYLEVARRTGARTVDLIELGSSAGLNLVWDRYRYVYAAGTWGPADAPLELRGEERRPVPATVVGRSLDVRSRVGVDRAPIDLTTDEGARLLKSFVWPDHATRLEQLDRAIEALRRDPPELVRGDIVDELPKLLQRRRDGALTLVSETAVLGYLSSEDRLKVFDTLERASADGPLAFVRAGRPGDRATTYYALVIRIWPDAAREEVGHGDFHGAWLDWRV
jgi:hypothetical protein